MFRLLIALTVTVLGSFSPSNAQTKPAFEVATIKPNAAGDNRIAILRQPGGRFVASGVTLKILMGFAYGVRDFQILGGPAWANTDRWNVEAKAEESSIPLLAGPVDPAVPNPLLQMV